MTSSKTCSFETCERPVSAKGLCDGHWKQQHKGKPLTPILVRAARISSKGKTCSVEHCDKDARTGGMCNAHYQVAYRGVDPSTHVANNGGRRPKSPNGQSPEAEARKRKAAESKAFRDWARDNGYDVGVRGVIPQHIKDAYWSAQDLA